MPTKQLKTWAKEAKKTVKQAEDCWDKAKEQANKVFPKGEEDPNYWKFVNSKTRYCLGLKDK